jgi:integrase
MVAATVKALDDRRYQRLLELTRAANPRAWALFYLTGHLGLRVSEATEIRFNDFARVDEELLVEVPTVKKRGGGLPRLPVYVAPEVRDTIVEALTLLEGLGPLDRVFPVSTRWLQKVWRRWADRAGITELGIHSLRHWFGVATYRATKNLVFTRDQMRHSDVGATQVYARIVDGRAQAALVRGIG